MEGTEVRLAEPGDGDRLLEIFLDAIHGQAAPFYEKSEIAAWTSRMDAKRLETRLLSTVTFVAVVQGVIAGFGALDIGHAELDFLYVHPDFTRQGVGRKLAETVEARARAEGLKRLELTASLNALVAYERLGYVRVRDMVKTIDRVPVRCIRMAKELP